uniref:Uncharacterized protein n=1 Tax=Lutzomyia longipalpis TaxID=7200 RepID=A0A1B0CAZ4_LUTLO
MRQIKDSKRSPRLMKCYQMSTNAKFMIRDQHTKNIITTMIQPPIIVQLGIVLRIESLLSEDYLRRHHFIDFSRERDVCTINTAKKDLMGHNERHHRSRRHDPEDYDFMGNFGFTFRDPEEVFREFFGNSPFAEIFGAMPYGATNGRRSHRHSHPQNTISSQFMSPFMGISLMDDFFTMDGGGGMNGAFTSFSSFNTAGGGGGGAVKRTSTSTTFVNGKKLMTKRIYENGKETVMSYENDVLKSKTVNGVAQALSYN